MSQSVKSFVMYCYCALGSDKGQIWSSKTVGEMRYSGTTDQEVCSRCTLYI